MIQCDEDDTAPDPVVFLPKQFLWLIMRKISGKSQLSDILQNIWTSNPQNIQGHQKQGKSEKP